MRGVCKNFFCKFDFYKKCCGGVGEAAKSRFCGQKFRIATRELVHCNTRIGALRQANWCIAASELVRRTTENPWGLLRRTTDYS